jgi:hypothetical protein
MNAAKPVAANKMKLYLTTGFFPASAPRGGVFSPTLQRAVCLAGFRHGCAKIARVEQSSNFDPDHVSVMASIP